MKTLDDLLKRVVDSNPGEPEFHQAVEEVFRSVYPVVRENPIYQRHAILERIVVPERAITFRTTWLDDKNIVHVNQSHRVEFSGVLGPFKGGLRLHPSVDLGLVKFLGFEQTFKNSLTGLMLGGGKGGSDFNPKGKSDFEVMRFCQAFMRELYRHIGKDTDVPAGDIGVGEREIGFMFGEHRVLTNSFTGAFTGKNPEWGGSYLRPEATGYGLIFFVEEMLKQIGQSLAGKLVAVSGSGNVAQYAIEKAILSDASVVTASDSSGFFYDRNGINGEKLAWLMELKNVRRGRIKEYAEHFSGVDYFEKPIGCEIPTLLWERIPRCDIALPCATENEIDAVGAKALVDKGVMLVAEGANMPSTKKAIQVFHNENVLFGPAKAANAGGVAVSGLEMAQNSGMLQWNSRDVLARLQMIMHNIHKKCVKHGTAGGKINYVDGANIAGFIRVANAMVAQGL